MKLEWKAREKEELLPAVDGLWNGALDLPHFLPEESRKMG